MKTSTISMIFAVAFLASATIPANLTNTTVEGASSSTNGPMVTTTVCSDLYEGCADLVGTTFPASDTIPVPSKMPEPTNAQLQAQLAAMQVQLDELAPKYGRDCSESDRGRCMTYAELTAENKRLMERNNELQADLNKASRYNWVQAPPGNYTEYAGYTLGKDGATTRWYNLSADHVSISPLGDSYRACYIRLEPWNVSYRQNEICRIENEYTGQFTTQRGWSWLQIGPGPYGEQYVRFERLEIGTLNVATWKIDTSLPCSGSPWCG